MKKNTGKIRRYDVSTHIHTHSAELGKKNNTNPSLRRLCFSKKHKRVPSLLPPGDHLILCVRWPKCDSKKNQNDLLLLWVSGYPFNREKKTKHGITLVFKKKQCEYFSESAFTFHPRLHLLNAHPKKTLLFITFLVLLGDNEVSFH